MERLLIYLNNKIEDIKNRISIFITDIKIIIGRK